MATAQTDPDHEYIEYEAHRIAATALRGIDTALSWREAGYHSPEAAAEVLIGDGDEPEPRRRAIEIVAAALRAC